MSTRSKWCEFDKETRKYIKKRDNNECVICHSKGALQIAHIFLSRANSSISDIICSFSILHSLSSFKNYMLIYIYFNNNSIKKIIQDFHIIFSIFNHF